MDSKKWFKEAKFGMFIHFGLYSLLSGEYMGERNPYVGEWSQSYFKIPNVEYEKLASAFNPIYFDAEEIVQLAKKAGMQYIVITSKHHDGFSLYKTKYSSYNVFDMSPFQRDIVKELSDACKKYDMRFGIYYSQALDWREYDGASYDNLDLVDGCMTGSNTWDFPYHEDKDYRRIFKSKIYPQVEELLTNYGELAIMWFDCGYNIDEKSSIELYDLVKKHQPNCLVNSRIGREGEYNIKYDFLTTDDNQLDFNNDKEILCEVPATLNDTWGFKYFDNNWKTAKDVVEIKNRLNSQGVNLILNIGPDYLGRIPVPTIEILEKVGEMDG